MTIPKNLNNNLLNKYFSSSYDINDNTKALRNISSTQTPNYLHFICKPGLKVHPVKTQVCVVGNPGIVKSQLDTTSDDTTLDISTRAENVGVILFLGAIKYKKSDVKYLLLMNISEDRVTSFRQQTGLQLQKHLLSQSSTMPILAIQISLKHNSISLSNYKIFVYDQYLACKNMITSMNFVSCPSGFQFVLTGILKF